MKNRILFILLASCGIVLNINTVFGQSTNELDLQTLIIKAISNSEQLHIRQFKTEQVNFDKRKAFQAYLPNIQLEGTYTRLNDDIRLPADMEQLLSATQSLLIKESAAMQMASLPVPDEYKVQFNTLYNGEDAASLQLQNAISENLTDIPPIQNKDITKLNVSGQMVLFSGLKVPYSIKAANHVINSYNYLNVKETNDIVANVASTYYKLTVLNESENALKTTETYLNEQTRFVEKAKEHGLAIELDLQKIMLAKQQLEIKKIELVSNKKLVVSKLAAITGIEHERLDILKPDVKPLDIEIKDIKVESYNEIEALEEGLLALDYKRKAEYSEYVPKVFAFGKKELVTSDLSAFDPEWYVGVGVRWNIFDGLTAHNSAQKTKIDWAILNEKKSEATKYLTINSDRLKYDHEKYTMLLDATEKQFHIAEKTFDLTKKQYKAGLTTMTEFLEALSVLESSRLDFVKTTYAYNQSLIDYLNATGQLSVDLF